MPKYHPSASSCVEHATPGGTRRLGGSEAVVIIVVVALAAVLVAVAGVPGPDVLWLLAGAVAGIGLDCTACTVVACSAADTATVRYTRPRPPSGECTICRSSMLSSPRRFSTFSQPQLSSVSV